MDILKSKTVTCTEGASTVSTGGLSLSQIIAVKRQGLQHDYIGFIGINTANRSWSYVGGGIFNKRLVFNSNFPFAAGEEVFIIYKEGL